MRWINFLHFYQPANLEKEKVIEATKQSYARIVRGLEEHPNIKFTLNIAGCLIKRWDEEPGLNLLIQRIKRLVRRGQIELTGSAAYHPFLPLIGEKEALEQIREQEKILKKSFGPKLKLAGFFSPEMAYAPSLAKLIKKLGYRWLMLDEISAYGKLNKVEPDKKYFDRTSGLILIFRNRKISDSYVPERILKLLKEKTPPTVVVTASDAELYGLRHVDHTAVFEKLLKQGELRAATVSDYLKSLKIEKKIKPLPSSWQSSETELKNRQPYALWYNKNNPIQRSLWQLAGLAQKLFERHAQDANAWWARWHLVRGLSSCTFWWASNKNFSAVFGPTSWSPDEIERGLGELIRSIRSLEKSTDLKTKLTAENLTLKIKKMIWQKHWRYVSKK